MRDTNMVTINLKPQVPCLVFSATLMYVVLLWDFELHMQLWLLG